MCRILFCVHQKTNPWVIEQHRVLVIFRLAQMKKVIVIESFDRKHQMKNLFCRDLESSDWRTFYRQVIAEDMLTVFSNIFEKSLEKCVTKRKLFIRNDKGSITIPKSWIETQ